jgi:hypothetical protein
VEKADREVLMATLTSVQYAHVELDPIRELLEENGEEEEETDR